MANDSRSTATGIQELGVDIDTDVSITAGSTESGSLEIRAKFFVMLR